MSISHHAIPVFMYHAIVSPDAPAADGREDGAWLYDLPVKKFQAHMVWLRQQSYLAVKVGDQLPAGQKGVILTFDDGEMNNYAVAVPILKLHGFRAYFFVTPERVGRSGYMDWPQLREMLNDGMMIGAHGLTHAVLPPMNDQDLRRELQEAKRILEARLIVTIDTLSIPRGFYDDRVVKFAAEAGYQYIFVSDVDPRWPGKVIGRIAVKADWSADRLGLALAGRIPLGEKIGVGIKNSIKRCVPLDIYNRLRQLLLGKK